MPRSSGQRRHRDVIDDFDADRVRPSRPSVGRSSRRGSGISRFGFIEHLHELLLRDDGSENASSECSSAHSSGIRLVPERDRRELLLRDLTGGPRT